MFDLAEQQEIQAKTVETKGDLSQLLGRPETVKRTARSFRLGRGKALTNRKRRIDSATDGYGEIRHRAEKMGLTVKIGRHNPRRGNMMVLTFTISEEALAKLRPESKVRKFTAGQWWPGTGALVVNGGKVDGTLKLDEVLTRIAQAFDLKPSIGRKVSPVSITSKHGQTPQAKQPPALRTVENGATPSASGVGATANTPESLTANIARRKASEAEEAEEASRQQRQRDKMGGGEQPSERNSRLTHTPGVAR